MLPINFPEANGNMQKPLGWTDEQCSALPVFSDGTQYFSCWQPSYEDIQAIAAGKPIWLNITGIGHPPVMLTTEFPFKPIAECMDYVFIKDFQPTMKIDGQIVNFPGMPLIPEGYYIRKENEGLYLTFTDKGICEGRVQFFSLDLVQDYIQKIEKPGNDNT